MLWDTQGVLALGWIVAFFEGFYIIMLHQRAGAIYREYVEFAKSASKDVLPVLEKSTQVMSQVLSIADEQAEKIDVTKTRQDQFIGQLDILIRSFIDTHTYRIGQTVLPSASNAPADAKGA